MKKELSQQEKNFCGKITDELIRFWEFHKRFDANIKGLAKYSGVSRDTIYRWLNRKAHPKPHKARLVSEWLKKRQAL